VLVCWTTPYTDTGHTVIYRIKTKETGTGQVNMLLIIATHNKV